MIRKYSVRPVVIVLCLLSFVQDIWIYIDTASGMRDFCPCFVPHVCSSCPVSISFVQDQVFFTSYLFSSYLYLLSLSSTGTHAMESEELDDVSSRTLL